MYKRYPIAVERGGADSAYGVIFPDVAGCYSAGDTLDEAIENAKEALEGFFELAQMDGEELPEPSRLEEHSNNEEFKDFIWSFIEIDITPYLGKSKKVNVTLPEFVIKQIDTVATTMPQYKTRSGFLAAAAMHELESLR